MSLRQDPDTLVYGRFQDRSDFIGEQLLQDKGRPEVINAVLALYGEKRGAVEKAVDRTRKRLEEKARFASAKPKDGQN